PAGTSARSIARPCGPVRQNYKPSPDAVNRPGFSGGRVLPGRSFASPDDFNQQLNAWLPIANAHMSRSRRGRPSDLVGIDRAAMRGLPAVAPGVMFRTSIRLPRDYYVRAFSNDYSVDPALIGRIVEVSASLDAVAVHHDGVLIGSHARRWARQLTVTGPVRVARAAELRA
ncbi:Mu transposase domain-containing protein, partial [Microbacterium sp. A84]|uniref:Mu transposase domain-containing protein n=1 Tax=Microbacterium sp. A84 TaxID=3450715 RepID=UPI003F444C99